MSSPLAPNPDAFEPPWDDLEALADGALPPSRAARLHDEIRSHPGWPEAWARCEAVSRALGTEGLYPFPPDLALRILADTVGAPRLGALALLGRLAAAVALAVGAWSAWLGGAPAAPSSSGLPAWSRAPVDVSGSGLWAAAPAVPSSGAPWLAAGAVGLVAVGVVLARRWGTGPSQGEAS